MDSFRVLLTQAGQAWRRLNPNQRVTVLAAVLLAVCAAVALTMWARRPDFVMLYSGLDPDEGAAIVERLEADKVPYRLTRGGTAIEVPHTRLYQLRMELASRGVVKPAHLGFELFDRHDIGMTDFVQKTNYRRALEGELARTIESLEDVESARVHIVVPEPSLFADDERRPSASILLTLARGGSMNREEVAGITRLVAGSVEGLKPDDVTVVSSEGTVLTLAGEAEGPMGLTSRQLAARQAVENYLTHKAQSLLESVVGPGKAVVRVDADLDFEQLERSTERFDPAGRAIRSEERETEEGADSGTGNREHTIANYEVSKTVERILGAAGGVKRLSVAVVVDGTYAETPGPEGKPTRTFVTRPPESLAEFGRMVRNAIGVDEKRGDVFEIACIALTSSAPPEEKPAVPAVILRDAGRYAPRILPVAGFLVLLLLLRRTLGGLTSGLPVSGAGPRPASAAGAVGGEETDLDRDRQQLRERVEAIARERPEAAAKLIRTWLLEKK